MLKQLRATGFLAGVLCSVMLATGATAQSASYHFDIPGKALSEALRDYGQVSGLDIIFTEDLVRGLSTTGLLGEFTPEAALQRLLQGTGLIAERSASGALMIQRVKVDRQLASEFSDSKAGSLGQRSNLAAQAADADAAESASLDDEDGDAIMDPDYVSDENPRGIPEILVIGQKSLNADIVRTRDDVQPYVVFDRDVIERSGAVNIEEFLKRQLPMNTAVHAAGGRGILGNASQLNIRGLGANQTLVLIDGRRTTSFMAANMPNQPDLNGIPLSAVERIEVLPTTASGIYGGGATGGVINVVLRRDYAGAEAKLSYDNTFDSDSARRRIDMSAGFDLEGGKTNILLIGSYSDGNLLLSKDRNFARDGRWHAWQHNPAGFTAFFPPVGATTNIRSANGANLTLDGGTTLNSPITFVPIGYEGASTDGGAALLANAGRFNLDLADTAAPVGGGRSVLASAPTVESLRASIRRSFTSRVETFLELSGSRNEASQLQNAAVSGYIIPGAAPTNPFQEDILVSTPAYGADETQVVTLDNRRAVGGVVIQLPKGWTAGADYLWEKVRFHSLLAGLPDTAAVNAALASGDLDVLRDSQGSVDFGPFLFGPGTLGPAQTVTRNAVVRLAGPLLQLPAGGVEASILVERRDENYSDNVSTTPGNPGSKFLNPGRSQSVDSIYLELLVPIFTARNARPGLQLLELRLAGRRDAYTVDGATNSINLLAPAPIERFSNTSSSTDSTFGVRFQPLSDVMLRASYGTGYLPPAVHQLAPAAPRMFSGTLFGLTDPRRGDEPIGQYTRFGGGSSALNPERSESWSAGLVLTPRNLPQMRISLDWSKIDKRDNIVNVATGFRQSDLDNESFVPGLITRGPVPDGDPFGVGPVIGINAGLFNIAKARMEAYDFAIDYRWDTAAFGSFELSSVATRLVHLQTQLTPIAPVVENAGVSGDTAITGALDWKANLTLTWEYGDATVGWATRYLDSYWVNPDHAIDINLGASMIPSQTYHDLFGSYRFGSMQGRRSLLSDVEIQFGIRNLFNHAPPMDSPTRIGYSAWGDPRLASYYVAVRKSVGW